MLPPHVSAAPGVEAYCRSAARLLVCLDYDGTLAPIAARPEEARPTPPLLELLARLTQSPDMDVAVVSGRTLADLRALLPIPGLAFIGVHGAEVCTAAGETVSLMPTGAFSTILTLLRPRVEGLAVGVPGVFVENKEKTLALHYRLAQPREGERVVAEFLAVIRGYQSKGVALEVVHGKKVVEVRPVGINKGKAVQFLLQAHGPAVLPIYIGDDATDEDAFRVLPRRGLTILVADPPRRTSARYHLRNPEEVRHFLARLPHLRGATGEPTA